MALLSLNFVGDELRLSQVVSISRDSYVCTICARF